MRSKKLEIWNSWPNNFFSDEKTFKVTESYNHRNSRYLAIVDSNGDMAIDHTVRYATSSKHPESSMFLGAVASTGEVSPPIWFDGGYILTFDIE